MTEGPLSYPGPDRAPTHLWVVGLLLVLWNGWGIAVAIAAQTDRLPAVDAATSVYFDAQPLWLALFADLGALAGIAGSIALLLQSRWATWCFVAQIAVIALANAYEVATGTSLLLSDGEARVTSLVLFLIMAGQIAYARAMRRRGVLG